MSGGEQEHASEPLATVSDHAPAGRAGGSGGIARKARGFQGSIGNAAFARMLQRDDSAGGPGAPPPAQTSSSDQSSAGGPAKVGPPDFKKLVAEKDTGGIRQVTDFSGAEPADRIAMIHALLEDTWWVGGSDRIALCHIWDGWGPGGIAQAYAENEALWDRCVEKEANLAAIPALQPFRDSFASDVKAVANAYQTTNAKAVKAERGRLNLGGVDDVLKVGGDAAPGNAAVIEVQQIAREVKRADDILDGLYAVPVGTAEVSVAPRDPGKSASDRSSGGGTGDGPAPAPAANAGGDSGGGPGTAPPAQGPVTVDFMYHPDKRPPGGFAAGREKEFRTWEDVDKEFKRTTAARAILASKSPALFAATSGKPDEVGHIASASPQEAATLLGKALNATEEAIKNAGPMIADDTINWKEFTPIHQQLWEGAPAKSGLQWNTKLAKSVSKDVIGEYHTTDFWRKLGLMSVGAAAFLFSEIATGGMATFLWAASVGAGATQAGLSVQNYTALATAAQTATSKDTQLVTTEQVGEAQAAAVLDTAFAFLDLVLAAKGALGGAKAAQAASKVAAREGLEGFAAIAVTSPDKAAAALRTAITELGPQEAIRRTGMKAEDLVKLVGGEKTAEGKLLAEAGKDAAVVRSAGAGLASLPAGVATERGRRYAKVAIDRVYSQWAALATPEARLSAMVDILNPEIASMGAQRVGSAVSTTMTLEGEMAADLWQVHIHPSMLPSTVTEAQFSSVWSLVSHEFEHGIQNFTSAQVRATTNPAITASELAGTLGIPEHVAEQAIQVQKGTRVGVKLVQGTPAWTAAAGFEASLIGAGTPRNAILDTLWATSHEQKDAAAVFKPLEKSPVTGPGSQGRVRAPRAGERRVRHRRDRVRQPPRGGCRLPRLDEHRRVHPRALRDDARARERHSGEEGGDGRDEADRHRAGGDDRTQRGHVRGDAPLLRRFEAGRRGDRADRRGGRRVEEGGRWSGAMIEELADVMRRLSAGGDAAELAQGWEQSAAPFASVTVRSWASEERPWSDVDIAFAPGEAPTLAELEAAFGPFSEPPRLSSGTRRLRGEWWETRCPSASCSTSSPHRRDATSP